MSNQNVPCKNPSICKVQTHRPGTVAECQPKMVSKKAPSKLGSQTFDRVRPSTPRPTLSAEASSGIHKAYQDSGNQHLNPEQVLDHMRESDSFASVIFHDDDEYPLIIAKPNNKSLDIWQIEFEGSSQQVGHAPTEYFAWMGDPDSVQKHFGYDLGTSAAPTNGRGRK